MRKRADQTRSGLKQVFITVLGFIAFFGMSSLSEAQTQTTLRKIEIIGLQRLSPDEVIQSSGLQLGQAIDGAMIDAAMDRLMKSGLFRTVSYRVRTAENESIVVFEVAENAPAAPGAAEILGQVQWAGNQVLSIQQLSTAFALRPGDRVDSMKIQNGLDAVRKAYGRQGYITASTTETSMRDAATRRVNYQFMIREGQQYRMGALTITGLGPADVQRLKAKWTLAPGAIFDDSYPDEFKQNAVRPFVAAMTARTRVRAKFDFESKPDVRKQIVDVVINFR